MVMTNMGCNPDVIEPGDPVLPDNLFLAGIKV
jgi:hypothetical protein